MIAHTNEQISTLLHQTATRFIARAEILGLTGSKRDDAALDYFCGAAGMLEDMGAITAARVFAAQCALVISVMGYLAVKNIEARNASKQNAA